MARKPTTPQPPQQPPRLRMPPNEARERLLSRREIGQSLLETKTQTIRSEQDFDAARAEFKKWNEYNVELLRRMFDTDEYSKEYDWVGNSSIGIIALGGGRDIRQEIEDHIEYFGKKIVALESLAERVDLIDLAPGVEVGSRPTAAIERGAQEATPRSSKKVFLVHGQDSETKAVVARFIEHCGLEPIILHEQPDQGRTIIEKFEGNADVAFAVVLLTPDDLGGLRPDPSATSLANANPRARQNVILELGYFIGKLGRKNVCALKKGEVELPSDFSGVVYTPYDGADEGWKLKLAREMRVAGLDVDMNKVFG